MTQDKRQYFGYGLLAASLLAFLGLGGIVASVVDANPRTDDAFLQANIINMAPEVSGRIIDFKVYENQHVHKGDVLFVIDPEPFQYALEQAQANLENLQAQLPIEGLQIGSQIATAQAQTSGVAEAQAQLALARSTLSRVAPLAEKGFATSQQLDQANTAVRTAAAALAQAQHAQAAAEKNIRNDAPLRAQISGARAKLSEAERNLRLTRVLSPCDGQITGLNIAAGEFATTGKPLFTVIDTERWWVVANFRETQIPGFHSGQSAVVHIMSRPGLAIQGHVESLSGGVQPDVGTVGNSLPQVARNLNWVRIAQRFPVRIRLDNPPQDLMRIGATVVVTVRK